MDKMGGTTLSMIPETMRAILITGERELEYKNVPTPSIKPNEVLVKVRNVGVCGTDLEIYHGVLGYIQSGLTTFPLIPGHEWSGEVLLKGDNVHNFEIGDRVVGETTLACGKCDYCRRGLYNLCPDRLENGILGKDGAAAEYMAFPVDSLYKFQSLSFEQACLIEPAAVAFRGMKRANVTPEDHVIVFGAGTIGLLSVQMAKAFGARKVTLVDYLQPKLDIGKELGADQIINLSQKILANEIEDTGSVFIEASGNPKAFESIISIADISARVCLLGVCGGRKASIDIDKIVLHELNVFGSLSSPGVWESVIKLIDTGKINLEKLITHKLPFTKLEQAFQLMENKDQSLIKAIIEI